MRRWRCVILPRARKKEGGREGGREGERVEGREGGRGGRMCIEMSIYSFGLCDLCEESPFISTSLGRGV